MTAKHSRRKEILLDISNKETFREKLLSLVDKFNRDSRHYLSKDYLEAQAREDFINPLFEALGWDIENKKGLSPHEREVMLEKGETTGRPDYNFRAGGSTKFFVEAKAPSAALDNVTHILQAKTYAWSTKEVYFVILTDFEELKLFDASLKPDPRHPGEGLIFDLKYAGYLENIDKLYLLSREEVEKGSLERLLPRDVKSKRLRIPVDRAFLEEMTGWREELAKDVHKRNPSIDVKLLNEVVQRLLDRIVFIRIAEDRKIRDPHELRDIVEIWKEEGKRKPLLNHLKDLFREVNDDLNGDIFKPHACETIDVDSGLLAEIIENLYFPKCRYRFEVLGVELLGSIYERYLGNTIRVTPKRVVVEEKPEVRKAGGVYYTPKYIVDYIVKNTVGKLIEGKTPKEIENIRILDPACGSGSFLLWAYQRLLDYHLKYYREHPKETKTIFFDFYTKISPEDMTLPLRLKARILKNNIFGVDIDPQAVEITMMSLYLKLLEGERNLPAKQALLPGLSSNIKCGNSLIGYDMFEQGELFGDEVRGRINPFDWNSKATGFGEIMEKGGFDCVIGNPPWGAEFTALERNFLAERYPIVPVKTKDSYIYFLVKSISLLRTFGVLGYIIPNTWLLINNAAELRRELLSLRIEEIIDHGDGVFGKVTAESMTIVLAKAKDFNKKCRAVRFRKGKIVIDHELDKKVWLEDRLSRIVIDINKQSNKLLKNLRKRSIPFEEECIIIWGIKPYQVGYGIPPQTRVMVEKRIYHAPTQKGKDWKPLLVGSDVNRYGINFPGNRFINYGKWLMYPSNERIMVQPKIVMRQTSDILRACYDESGYYCQNSVFLIHSNKVNLKFLLGLLNSKLLSFVYKLGNPQTGKVFAEIKPSVIKQLPICKVDFKNPKEKFLHDKLVSLVESMLGLNKKKNTLPPSTERERIEREIAITDEKIDDIVYTLYGITDKERKVIEGKE